MYEDFKPVVQNEDDKYYPYECAFDFEALFKQIQTNDDGKQLKIVTQYLVTDPCQPEFPIFHLYTAEHYHDSTKCVHICCIVLISLGCK